MPNVLNGIIEFDDTLLYLDQLGHTLKSQDEYYKHKTLASFRALAKENGDKFNYLLTEKPVTIINKSYYKDLKEILIKTLKMWTDLDYWSDNILLRSGSYTTKQGLFSKNIPNDGIESLEKTILNLIFEGGNPDQILLHPLPSLEIFENGFYAIRCYMIDGICNFDLGFGNIDQVWKLEQANNIVKGSVFNNTKYEVIQGQVDKSHENIINRVGLALHQFCVLAPGLVAPYRKQGTRALIYELKGFYLEDLDKLIIEFIDFEIYK